MNFVPSLEHLALVKVAISIHNSSEFLESKEKFRLSCDSFDMFPVKRVFREILLKLVIPDRLCEKLLGIIKPISNEIDTWKMELLSFGIHKQLDICLTSSGTIDRMETAKKFVRSEDQNVVERFALACHFWMTDDVLKMWNKASVDEKIHIEKELLHPKDSFCCCLRSPRLRTEVQFQRLESTHYLKRWFGWLHDGGDPCTQRHFLKESLFLLSCANPTPNMLRAFPPQMLRVLIKHKYDTFYGRAYFSCLDYNQKLRFFQQEPLAVLRDYLKWPLQFKFLEMAGQAWNYMTVKDFYDLLYTISEEKMSPRSLEIDHESDFDYEGLLHEFWEQSPHHLKISAKEFYVSRSDGFFIYPVLARDSPLKRLLENNPSVSHHQRRRRFVDDM
ncbi:uncharacterized protein TNIN_92081 [Trichonephila inaurata madagascariensis]|uniref:Uncharacterized protein n=1 Tax=Trichonephila inaurata madagascariensis TaxID=2747483 RepID=A0A8X6YRS7_9ARAC|nr:uncharacterized protein TNIN_92081 [Trichonephila inaurata madagascariensis]